MFILEDQIGIQITISGNVMPIGTGTLQNVSIMQNMNNLMLTADITVIDSTNLFETGAFSDHAPVEIVLGPAIKGLTPPPISMRLFNIKDVHPTTAGYAIHFTAVFDNPELFRKPMTKAYKGTSADAISRMAGEVGMNVETSGTSDSQTWLPNNRPIGQAMRRIADHGYASAQSAMHLTMGMTGGQPVLLYKDLMQQLQSSKAVFTSLQGFTGEGFPILSWKCRNHSGTLNSQFGFGGNAMQTKTSGKTEIEKDVDVPQTGIINMNSSVQQAIGELSRFFFPHDTSNVHKNYQKARVQNEKMKSTLSGFLDVVTNFYTDLKVTDGVDVVITDGKTINARLSGRYMVHSRTQYVKDRMYREKLTLSTQGGGG